MYNQPITDAASGTDPAQNAAGPPQGLDGERYRAFLLDLCGVMAYGELSAFERLSSDARFSPTLHDRATLGRLAVTEFQHYELVCGHLARMGAEAEATMQPFQKSIDAFHDRTRPADWYESIMKAYVLDAISGDFYRAVGTYLDPQTRQLIGRIQVTEEQSAPLMIRLKQALSDDPRLSSRLALWGRRLVGEALTQAQRVGLERAFLTGLIGADAGSGRGGSPEGTQNELLQLFAGLTRSHSRRMSQLGLTA